MIAVVYLDLKEKRWWREAMRLARVRQDMAVLEERQEIAREMHDGVGALMSAVLFQTEYLTEVEERPETRAELQELQEKVRKAITELRQVVRVMREEFDLRERLEEAVATASDIWGFGVVSHVDVPQELTSPMLRLAVFRILQEALTNAGKHSGARTVEISVTIDSSPSWAGGTGDGVLVTVSDDGRGAATEELDKDGHYGLVGMRERVERIGGSLRITTAPDKGFTIEAWVPLEGVVDV